MAPPGVGGTVMQSVVATQTPEVSQALASTSRARTSPTSEKPKRSRKHWQTPLAHAAYSVEPCPRCEFPEADGGYCPECGWTCWRKDDGKVEASEGSSQSPAGLSEGTREADEPEPDRGRVRHHRQGKGKRATQPAPRSRKRGTR